MTSERLASIVALLAVLALILSRYARGRDSMRSAGKMFGWGLVVAAGILLAAYVLERLQGAGR
jgi:hypothetical protein